MRRNVLICLNCFQVTIDGVPCTDHDSITKMILSYRYDPLHIFLEKCICKPCLDKIGVEKSYDLFHKS
jgi:hypothetical protein